MHHYYAEEKQVMCGLDHPAPKVDQNPGVKVMLYHCSLVLHEILKDAEILWQRCIDLPFAPTSGLTIHFSEETCDYEVQDVAYHVEDGSFRCFSAISDAARCQCKGDCCRATDERSEWMMGEGWTLVEEHRGESRKFTFKGMIGKRPKHGIKLS